VVADLTLGTCIPSSAAVVVVVADRGGGGGRYALRPDLQLDLRS
jgi:hypothetical protein